MQGLAIAALILGIIGFLFSFLFGLGIFSSVTALILGLISCSNKMARKIAIGGVVLGLVGTIVSLSFFFTGKKFLKFELSKGIVESKKEPKEFIDISPVELHNLIFASFNDSKSTDLQREENWKRFRGKYVRWEGEVGEVRLRSNVIEVKFLHQSPSGRYIYVLVEFDKAKKDLLSRLSKGDTIIYTGKIVSKMTLWSYHFKLTNGDIFQQIRI